MQEVAVKLVSRIDSLRDPAAFRPWLRQIILNVCRGAARSHRPQLHLADDSRTDHGQLEPGRAAAPPAADLSARETLGRQEAAERLLEQALTLPPEYREPLLLRCMRSLTYQQISIILDLPVTTVETRLARARRMLREEIDEQIISEGCA